MLLFLGAAHLREVEEARPGVLGWHYSSNATCLIRSHLFYALFNSVKDHHTLLHNHSPLLKKTCVRQVVLDKWLPTKSAQPGKRPASLVRASRTAGSPSFNNLYDVTCNIM